MMKKILLILLCLPIFTIAQQKTYVPDDNFENYLENNGMGDGIALNDSVLTSNINTVVSLYNLYQKGISDLTGVEDFTLLEVLNCFQNNITEIDVTQNTQLVYLSCHENQLTSLDVSQNPLLEVLYCFKNNIQKLDVRFNPLLSSFSCQTNNLNEIWLGNNTVLNNFRASFNNLTTLTG
jgi:hypothetical protein